MLVAFMKLDITVVTLFADLSSRDGGAAEDLSAPEDGPPPADLSIGALTALLHALLSAVRSAFGLIAVFLARTVAARVIVAYGLGAALAAAVQAKGWPYHVLPGLSATILLAAVTISQTIDRYLPIDRAAHRLPVTAISGICLVL